MMTKGQADFIKAYERHKPKYVTLREFNIYNPILKKYCKHKTYKPLLPIDNLTLYTFLISIFMIIKN